LVPHYQELCHFLKKMDSYEELTPFRFSEETRRKLEVLLKALPKSRDSFPEDMLKPLWADFLATFQGRGPCVGTPLSMHLSGDDVEDANSVVVDNEDYGDDHENIGANKSTAVSPPLSQSSPLQHTPPTSAVISHSPLAAHFSSPEHSLEKSDPSSPIAPHEQSTTVHGSPQQCAPNNVHPIVDLSTSHSDRDVISLYSDDENDDDFITPKVAVHQSVASINKSVLQSHSWEFCQLIENHPLLKKQLQLDSPIYAPLWKNYYQFVKHIHAREYSLRLVSMNMLKLTPQKVKSILDSQDGDLLLNLMGHFDIIALQELEGCTGTTHNGMGLFYERLGEHFEYYIQSVGKMREGFLVNTTNVEVLECIDWDQGKMEHTPLELVVQTKKGPHKKHRIVNVHLKPQQKTSELITVLHTMAPSVPKMSSDESLHIVGDINYTFGGSSTNMEAEIAKSGWKWMNDVTEATTPTAQVYDALLMHEKSAHLVHSGGKKAISGVYKFPAVGLYDNLQKAPILSDHYPVYLLLE